MKNTLKTTLGCLLAAILIAGCEKNDAPQAAGATDQVPTAPQTTGAGAAAGPAPIAAPPRYSAAHVDAVDIACEKALNAADARGAGDAEFAIVEREACTY